MLWQVTRARAAERVAAGARDLGEKTANTVGKAASAVSHQVRKGRVGKLCCPPGFPANVPCSPSTSPCGAGPGD